MAGATEIPHRHIARRLLRDAAKALTTPLLPQDYAGIVNPLWSTRECCARVVAVRPETADSATVVLRPSRRWGGHQAGQSISLGVDINGARHRRSYSLTSVPGAADGQIAVTVKAVTGGRVSTALVHGTRPGAIVRLEAAAGDFVLPDACPPQILFVTAGSGITPVVSIIRTLMQRRERPAMTLVHVDRQADAMICGPELRRLARDGALTLIEHHTGADGRPSADTLAALVGGWGVQPTWACGPPALLGDIQAGFALAGVGERLRIERFSAPLVAADATVDGGPVTFLRSGRTVLADGTVPILRAGEEAGELLPSGCRVGICYTCVGRLRSGRVRDLRSGDVHGEPGDMIQTCVSVAHGPVTIEL